MAATSPRPYDWDAVLAYSSAAMSLSEQDVEELRSERSIKSTKTKEEIERLTVDESLNLLERSLYLIRTGQDVQKVNAVENLKVLLLEYKNDTISKFISCIQESLWNGKEELHIVASRVFCDIAESQVLTGSLYAKTLLPIILENIHNENFGVADAWRDALLTSLSFLPSETINTTILDLARSMGTLAQTVHSRLACCNLMGKLAINLDQMSVKRDMLKLVTALCQDVEMEVRAAMCAELDSVARGVGLELTRTLILPELVELTKDEQLIVRQAGIQTVSNILSLLDDDSCTDIMIPLVKNYCQKVLETKNEDETLTIAKHIGKLCYGLSINLTPDQRATFLDNYKQLCDLGDPGSTPRQPASPRRKPFNIKGACILEDRKAECRRWCAYNFPAMLLFAGADNFSETLLPTFQHMVNDPHAFVRRTIACGLHEVCKILGSKVGLIQTEIKILLQDDAVEVLDGLIPHLPATLETLTREGANAGPTTVVIADFITALLNCELSISLSSNWRLHVEFLTSLVCLPNCLSSDQIYYKFVPVLFRLLSSNRVIPVKKAAGRTLCAFIKNNKRTDQRNELCKRIIQELSKGNNYKARLEFLDICENIMEFFSKSFFKEHFFDEVLQLGKDPVVNVRLKVCRILPALKSQIRLPGDRLLLQNLEQNVRQLMALETDRDVSNAIRRAVIEMDRIHLSRDSSSSENMREEDLVDRKKEEQERQIVEDERKHENIVNRIASSQANSASNHKKINSASSSSKDITKKAISKNIGKVKELDSKKNSSKSDGSISIGSTSSTGKALVSRQPSNPISVSRAQSFTSGDARQKGSVGHRASVPTVKITPGKTAKTSSVDSRFSTTKKTVSLQSHSKRT
ncbi:serine/threonine-protein phosphatase 4 regulatory subunit 4-like [Rhopilema esculentum]|uniref:serine/threonine-protein phosphatase 4 regulatory subunit 4-like n=1 Tax=Rhopilema esculentum TaxID=499914 RepID=UPI0031DE97BE